MVCGVEKLKEEEETLGGYGNMININKSRRVYHQFCEWWQRDEKLSNLSLDEYIYNVEKTGIFWAKATSSYSKQKQEYSEVFNFDYDTITIETTDDVGSMKSGDIVKYRGVLWKVVAKQIVFDNNSEYYSHGDVGRTYIKLRK